MNIAARIHRQNTSTFEGFEPLTANFVYCPNQFFDVCLPYNTRGVVRLVAYIIRQSLGFRDSNGNPIRQNISVPFQDFINKAQISRGSIVPAIKVAIENNFIVCTKRPRAKSKGCTAVSGEYALKWGTNETYSAKPESFNGFYTGKGCRTPIPNSYFDQLVPNETLAVTKVVGAVLRQTVGYETQFGRREQVDLSYTAIQNFVKIRDRKTVADAIKHSLERQFIRRINAGKFASSSALRETARYSVKWLEAGKRKVNGSKSQPASNQFKKPTSIGSELPPVERFKKPTSLKTNPENENNKQDTVAVNAKAIDLLKRWFDNDTAKHLLLQTSLDEIENQVDWLPLRNPSNNPAGMLRRAIEERWSQPAAVEAQEQQRLRAAQRNETLEQFQEQAKTENRDALRRQEERSILLAQWNGLTAQVKDSLRETAIASAKSAAIKRILQRNVNATEPHWFILKQLQK
jgi:hypothetical protein